MDMKKSDIRFRVIASENWNTGQRFNELFMLEIFNASQNSIKKQVNFSKIDWNLSTC